MARRPGDSSQGYIVVLQLCLPGQASGQVHFRKVSSRSALEQKGSGALCYTPAVSPALLVDSCPRYRLWHSSNVGGTGTSLPALLLPLETVWLFFAESLRQHRVCGLPAVELSTSVFSPCSPAPSCVILNKLLHLSEPQCHLLHDVANNAVPERSL